MAKFHIGTPGGYDVEVTADSEDQALSIAKERWENLPRVLKYAEGGGRVLEQAGKRFFVSPGYSTADPARIEQIMQGADAASLSRQSFDEQSIAAAPLAARATKLVEGVPFAGTYVDEALGAVLGPQAQAGIRAQSAAMERQRPGQSIAANLAGGLLTGAAGAAALPAGSLPSAAASLRTIPGAAAGAAIGATGGALEGAVSGAGRGTDVQSRQRQAAQGAGFGAAAGGLLGAAVPLATKGVQNVVGLFRRSDVRSIARDLGISPDAARVIKNTFDQGGDFTAARANLARAGQEGMLADAGEAAQALLDATAASGGPAAQTVRGAVDARASRTGQALDATLDQTLGAAPFGPKTALDDIAARTAPQRAEAYSAAFSAPIDYSTQAGRNIEDVLSRVQPEVMMQAVNEANADMLARGMRNRQVMAEIGENGQIVFREMPNVQQLDEVKKALQRMAYSPANVNPRTGRLTGTGQRYNDLARQLKNATSEAVPEYGAAVALGGDKIAEENAFVLGQSLLNRATNVEDVTRLLGDKPSAAEIEAAKSGLRGAIDKAIGDVRAIASDPSMDARQLNQAFAMMSSDNAKAKIRALMGAEADAVMTQIDEAAQSLGVRAAVARNSATAARQAVQGGVEEMTSPGLLGTAMRGEPVDATKRMVQAITGQTDEYTATQRQRLYQDIARALTEKRGPAAKKALDNLQTALSGQSLTEAQTEEIAKALADVGFVAGATTGTRGLLAEEQRLAQ